MRRSGQVNDGHGGSRPVPINITATGKNDVPVLIVPGGGTAFTNEDLTPLSQAAPACGRSRRLASDHAVAQRQPRDV